MQMRQSTEILFAAIFGFSFGILASIAAFNSVVSAYLDAGKEEIAFYTVEALTDEMEVEWVSEEEE